MPLDYRSLLIAFALSGFGLATTFFGSWLVSRTERFLMAWTVGVASMALSALLLDAYTGTLSPELGAIAYTILLIGLAFVFGAAREFRTGVLPWRGMGLMATMPSMAVATPMLAGYNGASMVVLNIVAAIILLFTAWDYWLGRAEARLAITLLTGLYVLTGLSFVPCAALLLQAGEWRLTQPPSNWAEHLNIGLCLATLAGIGALSLALNQARLAGGHKRDAETDLLTGLLNRRALLTQFGAEIGGPASLVIFDIDHFKRVNDIHGHLAGDEVLRSFGEILTLSCRSRGLAARVGGEEFALFLPGVALGTAAVAAEGIRRQLARRRFVSNGHEFGCTVSAGVSHVEHGAADFGELLRDADKMLYAAKGEGRNRVVVGSDQTGAPAHIPPAQHSQHHLVARVARTGG